MPLLPLIFICMSCSQGVPAIHSTAVQLIRVQAPDKSFAERLSVFVFFDDSDGTSDFGSINITHTETGLYWNILPSNASVRLRGKDRWTGSASLAGPGGIALPAGPYHITVSDLAGNETGSDFILVRPDFPARAPVSFSINGDSWTLARSDTPSGFTRTFFLLFDKDSRLLYSWLAMNTNRMKMEGTLSSLRALANQTDYVQCYTENESGTAGVLLTPVHLR